MKVLIFRTCSVPININSYNVQEIGLAKSLVNNGNECGIIFYTNAKKSSIESLEYNGKVIKIYWMKGINFLHHGLYNLKSILNIVEDYDIVQCSDYNQIMTYKMLKYSTKPVVIYHGPYKNNFNWKTNILEWTFDLIFLKKMLNIQPTIICKSKLAENTLKEKGFKNLTTIPVGLDISRFLEKKDDKISLKRSTLLYVGQISKRRSIDFLLDLEKYLHNQKIDCELLLIGNGNQKYLKHILKRIEEENLQSDVKWIKKMSQDELCKYYNSSSVFLLPSNYEIFGMVLLEANYFNLPIISTLNGGSISIINDDKDGYIIEDLSLNEWANKVELLLSRKKTQRKFEHTWNDRLEKFLKIYKLEIGKNK